MKNVPPFQGLAGDGVCAFTQGGALRLRRDALPWARLSLPLRGVKTAIPADRIADRLS